MYGRRILVLRLVVERNPANKNVGWREGRGGMELLSVSVPFRPSLYYVFVPLAMQRGGILL